MRAVFHSHEPSNARDTFDLFPNYSKTLTNVVKCEGRFRDEITVDEAGAIHSGASTVRLNAQPGDTFGGATGKPTCDVLNPSPCCRVSAV